MKKTLLLLVVLTMIFSTICGVTVSADETITRVSLYNNLSYYSRAVPEGTKLNVVAYNAANEVVDLTGKTITYNSEQPWVVDIDENGYLVDGGYYGTAFLTAKVDGVPGSLVFVKTEKKAMNLNALFDEDTAFGRYLPEKYTGYTEATGTLSTVADAGHDGGVAQSGNYGIIYNRGAWDHAYKLRVAQGWFYDDGESALSISAQFSQFDQNHSSLAEPTWHNFNNWVYEMEGDKPSHAFDFKGNVALYCNPGQQSIKAAAGDETYDGTSIKRTVGWHQYTSIIREDATIDIYLDGEPVTFTGRTSTADGRPYLIPRGSTSSLDVTFRIIGTGTGYFDDFVLCDNPNTTEPAGFKLPAKSISLRENTSFYLNEVPAGTKLIVTPVDKNGDVGYFETQPTYTYESTRPWVLDIADDGTIVDGGYDGSTNVTVTASFANGQQYTASLIFIVASDNGYNAGEALGGNLYRDSVYGYSYINGYVGRTNLSLSSSTKPTTGGHDNGDYIVKGGTKGSSQDNSAALAGIGISWDVTAKIRLMQGWFYDDGASEFEMYFDASAAENSDAYINEGFMQDWPNYAYGRAYRHRASIVAAENSTAYSLNDLDNSNKVVYPINRSKGWHQATLVINSNGTINYFIDGKAFADTKLGANGTGHPQLIRILGRTPGNYDDFIMVSNENLTEPADYNTVNIAVDCDANGTVSYGGEVVSESVKVKSGANAEFTITPAEGYLIDKITYGDDELTDTEGKVTVVAKNATLSVTFKKEAVAPSIAKTKVISTNVNYNGAPAAITYLKVDAGTIGTVKETGILLGFDGVAEELRLIAYSDEAGKIPVTDGEFAIKVFGSVLHGTACTSKPFVTYTDETGDKTEYAEAESFTITAE